MMINLQEFIDWYKKSEIQFWNKKRVFREPRMKDMSLGAIKMLEANCIEWDWSEFKDILEQELWVSKSKEVIENILKELGLT